MGRFSVILIVLILVAVGGGFAFLATWEIPAPSKPVEKVIANDRFPR